MAARAPDGYLRIVGRRSTDLIKTGGYKVGAGEVETALLGHSGVEEAAVVARPDPDLGERIVAFVVTANGDSAPAADELIEHVASQLAPHKRPPRGQVRGQPAPERDGQDHEEAAGGLAVSAELLSILALAAMFVVATVLPINMGLLAFAAAFLVGTLAGDLTPTRSSPVSRARSSSCSSGITYLFGIAKANGTIDWLIRLAVRAVQGQIAAIPWIMFGVAATLTAIGAVSPAAVAIVAPIALGFAARYASTRC